MKKTIVSLASVAAFSGLANAQNVEVAQNVTINAALIGITTAGATGSSNFFDASGGSLVTGSVIATYSNVATNTSATILATGGDISNNTIWDIVLNTSLVQNDGSSIIDGNLQFFHGDILANGITDGFNEADGNTYTFIGSATTTTSNPAAGVYQITNDNASAGITGTIVW